MYQEVRYKFMNKYGLGFELVILVMLVYMYEHVFFVVLNAVNPARIQILLFDLQGLD